MAATLLTSSGSYMHCVAQWTALPAPFNLNYVTMIGLLVVLDPLSLIPFAFSLIVNILLTSLAITTHLIPSMPYLALQRTSGLLTSFLGTSGNWGILTFVLALLLTDSAAHIPSVKMAPVAENRLASVEQNVISHERNN